MHRQRHRQRHPGTLGATLAWICTCKPAHTYSWSNSDSHERWLLSFALTILHMAKEQTLFLSSWSICSIRYSTNMISLVLPLVEFHERQIRGCNPHTVRQMTSPCCQASGLILSTDWTVILLPWWHQHWWIVVRGIKVLMLWTDCVRHILICPFLFHVSCNWAVKDYNTVL